MKQACRACGRWECANCGAKYQRRSRYYPGKHHCPKCGSTEGKMMPLYHSKPGVKEDHEDVPISDEWILHYPLEEE